MGTRSQLRRRRRDNRRKTSALFRPRRPSTADASSEFTSDLQNTPYRAGPGVPPNRPVLYHRTEPARGYHRTGRYVLYVSTYHWTEPARGRYCTEPARGRYCTVPARGRYCTEPARGRYCTVPARGRYCTEPARGRY